MSSSAMRRVIGGSSGGANKCRAVMVAATKQHTGKTSVSMAILSGLRKLFGNDRVGYMKPVGQRHQILEGGLKVEDDVKMAKEFFDMKHCDYRHMSPIVLDQPYTRRFLDGKVGFDNQVAKIREGFNAICQDNDFVVVEGTGHVGVGSVIGLSNARVARELGVDMVLVAKGGIGSTFDELELNRQLCCAHGVKIRGIIMNKVQPNKLDMIRDYAEKAWSRYGIPIIACVPNKEHLDRPSLMDLEKVFNVSLLTGREHRLRKYTHYELVTTSLRRLIDKLNVDDSHDHTCFITHATRDDIVLGLLSHANSNAKFKGALILTGSPPSNIPNQSILDYIKHSTLPVLNVNETTSRTIRTIEGFTAKMCASDQERIGLVINHYEPHIDFHTLLEGRQPVVVSTSQEEDEEEEEEMAAAQGESYSNRRWFMNGEGLSKKNVVYNNGFA